VKAMPATPLKTVKSSFKRVAHHDQILVFSILLQSAFGQQLSVLSGATDYKVTYAMKIVSTAPLGASHLARELHITGC